MMSLQSQTFFAAAKENQLEQQTADGQPVMRLPPGTAALHFIFSTPNKGENATHGNLDYLVYFSQKKDARGRSARTPTKRGTDK